MNWAIKNTKCSTSAFGWAKPTSDKGSPDLGTTSWPNQGDMSVKCVAEGSIPTPPPTPRPTPRPTADLMQGRQPVIGSLNSNSCPGGSSKMDTENECKDAAGELGFTYRWAPTADTMPSACILQGTSDVYWNHHPTGGPSSVQ